MAQSGLIFGLLVVIAFASGFTAMQSYMNGKILRKLEMKVDWLRGVRNGA